ncbi:MAG: hypothetical protein R3C14_01755 [Caldilineaceae bacterium]
MGALMILAILGTISGGVGGALTNGVDGLVLGGSAGFVLGVLAWMTDNMTGRRTHELASDQILEELSRSMAAAQEQHAAVQTTSYEHPLGKQKRGP